MDELKRLLSAIEADLRSRSVPTPVFTFAEWLAIRRALAEAIGSK